MKDLLADISFKLVAYLLPWIVRHFYKAERILEKVKIRVQNEGDGITFNCGELPNVRIWLRITNLSPIELVIDRIYGHVFYGSPLVEFTSLDRRVVPTSSEIEFLIECALTQEHVQFLRRNFKKQDSWLLLSAFVHSRLHNFEIKERQVRAKNVEFFNCATP